MTNQCFLKMQLLSKFQRSVSNHAQGMELGAQVDWGFGPADPSTTNVGECRCDAMAGVLIEY